MKYLIICLVLLSNFKYSTGQQLYKILDNNGKEVDISVIIDLAQERPLIFFGELHDQDFAHLAELDLLKGLYSTYQQRVILGMEMFEADVQPIVDEYFSGRINQKSFETESRVWANYKEDYKPLLEFAKEQKLNFVASNVPRRYANSVYHHGLAILDSLSTYAKQFIPELPIKIDTSIQIYKEMLDMVPDHSNSNMVYSQGLKDATMAHFILKARTNGQIFLHINGAYHSKNKQGILSFLNGYPIDKTITINSILKDVEPDEIDYSSSDFTIQML